LKIATSTKTIFGLNGPFLTKLPAHKKCNVNNETA
jgi:hypothetical protein